MLENTRFHPGETTNDDGFARELAEGMELYVNDAFGSAHRAHSSTEAVAHLLPAYAGLLLLAELEHLGRLLGEVERPFLLIAGGAKVEDKIGVLRNIGERATTVIVGGKMAEELRGGATLDFPVVLPADVVAASAFAADAETAVVDHDDVPEGWLALDIGPRSRAPTSGSSSSVPGRSSGTARWVSSSGRRSPRARRRSRRPWPTPARPVPTRSSAAVTRCGRSRSSGSPTRSRGSRPGGGASLELLEGKALPGVAAIPQATE